MLACRRAAARDRNWVSGGECECSGGGQEGNRSTANGSCGQHAIHLSW